MATKMRVHHIAGPQGRHQQRSQHLYYKVLLRTTKYYSVLQSITPVLPCTTKYYSNTTLYYKVLLQYYKVLLKYFSVLVQNYLVLQSTTPVLLVVQGSTGVVQRST